MKLSVIICAYNPNKKIIKQVIESLKEQTLDRSLWELIVVDNNSEIPLIKSLDLDWHNSSKILLEKKTGLFFARLFGVENAISPLIVFVDDDNILNERYLEEALSFHQANPSVGCFGGKSLPVFEIEPPDWFFNCGIDLGCQDYGQNTYISNYRSVNFNLEKYPDKAPIGTGMVITKEAFIKYADSAKNSSERSKLGRKGKSLISGEDNDIILTTVNNGYEIAYVSVLIVEHFIPSNRLTSRYLSKMSYESSRSWVKVLKIHNLLNWNRISALTLPFRYIRSYWKEKAWRSDQNYIKWRGACGTFKGLSEIDN